MFARPSYTLRAAPSLFRSRALATKALEEEEAEIDDDHDEQHDNNNEFLHPSARLRNGQ